MQVIHNGQTVADIPVEALTDEAPRYERPMSAPASRAKSQTAKLGTHDASESLLKLLGSGNLSSKQWVFRQYDHMVRTNTAVLPGADAAVVRIKETRRALAMSLDGNGRYCAANPREGAKLIVAEAARNVVCVGARPLAITNCLNFASPERPEVMWSFSEVIDGMAEACRAFDTPVVSGNVSFYNETEGKGILPTPVIGMVGLLEDVKRTMQPGFKKDGDLIALLGTTADDLSLSEYVATVEGLSTSELIESGEVPLLDLKLELAVQQACLEAAEAGLLLSAHDCSDGGLAVTLAESCFSSLGRDAVGAAIELDGALSDTALLFSESPSRIVVSFEPAVLPEIKAIAERHGCPFSLIGSVGGPQLAISANGKELIKSSVAVLEETWRSSLMSKLRAEALAAG
jgi:phosphoribosylformylglycinamidine synthase II